MKLLLLPLITLMFTAQANACLLFSFSNLTCTDKAAGNITFTINEMAMTQIAPKQYQISTTLEGEVLDPLLVPSTETYDGITVTYTCDSGIYKSQEQAGDLIAISQPSIIPNGIQITGHSIVTEETCDENNSCELSYYKEPTNVVCTNN